jgi:CPA2 family monovalent cation:H+ antiporter-2
MPFWNLLIEIVMLLAAALVSGGIFARLGQSPLIGYLLAGLLLGGVGGTGLIASQSDIDAISELGVTLLLFSLGLEFSWERLRSFGRAALWGGVLQIVGTGAAVAGVAALFGAGGTAAVALGGMLAMSSTAAVLGVLGERGELDSPHGRNAIGVLLVQDVAVVPLAILMGVLGGGGGAAETAWEVARIALFALALVVAIFLFIKYAAVRLLAALSFERARELKTVLTFVIGFGSAWGAHAVGLSPALGSFVAGMLLGASPFATQIRADIASLRVLLLTLFFTSVGLAADTEWILSHMPLLLGLALAIVIGKAVVLVAITRTMGGTLRVGVATGMTLGQVGEFSFVLAGLAVTSGAIDAETRTMVISCGILTLIATPYLVQFAPAVARHLAPRDPEPAGGALERAPDVLIIGFGPAGQGVARALEGTEQRALIIDLNPRSCEAARVYGMDSHVGDATQIEVLEHARVREAKLVVVALPSVDVGFTILRLIRSLAPHVPVVVRSRYQRHAPRLADCGAHVVVDDEEEVARALGERVTELLREP